MTIIPEPTVHLFVYGTLMYPDVRRKVLGRDVVSAPAQMPGFVRGRIRIDGEEYPCAERGDGCLDGLVLDIARDELAHLDEYETRAYRRVLSLTADDEKAFLYVRND